MKRRCWLACLVCAAALSAQERFDVGGDFRGQLDAYLASAAKGAWTERAAKVAALKTPADVNARRDFIRGWMLNSIGGLPERTPLNPRITGTLERDGYRIEKLIFESRPRFYVTANVWVPTTGTPPYPAIVGVAGHSNDGKAASTYQYAWAGFAKRGFLVLAFDPAGQGERFEYLDAAKKKSALAGGTSEHIMNGLPCLLTGTNFATYLVHDAMRAIDYLQTRPDVDARRIAVAGNSGGGTQAAYLATVEPRLAAAVSSCYITSWETMWRGPGPQDSEQVFPSFLKDGLDFGDYLIGFAPRPILMTTAVRDFFPIAGARATYAEVRRVFEAANVGDRAGYFEFDDQHGWSQPRREAAYRWLSKWLQGREDEGREPPIAIEEPAALHATPTGQVATSFDATTVREINAARAAEMFAKRTALKGDARALRSAIRARLALPPAPKGKPRAETVATSKGEGYSLEKLKIATAPGIDIPALLFRPAKPAGAAVVWMDSRGKAAGIDRIEAAVRQGAAVLALDPRGMGESAASAKGKGYTPEYQTAMRALLVGRPMIGMQVEDALAALAYARSLPGVKRVSLHGSGAAGAVAILAAALDPSVQETTAEETPLSWMNVVRTTFHTGVANLIVPGVLADFDLPDVAGLIAPRRLAIASARDAAGKPIEEAALVAEYAPAAAAYRKVSAQGAIVLGAPR